MGSLGSGVSFGSGNAIREWTSEIADMVDFISVASIARVCLSGKAHDRPRRTRRHEKDCRVKQRTSCRLRLRSASSHASVMRNTEETSMLISFGKQTS